MSDPLCFVTWRWTPPKNYRSTFGPETVFALREMVARHYSKPHRFVCVTDQPEALPGIETIRLWPDLSDLPSPFGHSYPSCYRRLKVFAPDAGELFGPRLVSIDLDMVIVGNIEPLFDRDDEFIAWGESDFKAQKFCGSIWMLKTGTRPQVWTEFDPKTSPARARAAGCRGSDQAWLSYMLPNAATWGKKDGVYSYRKDIAFNRNKLPLNAKVVAFHGKQDPWGPRAQNIDWVKAHYPMAVSA